MKVRIERGQGMKVGKDHGKKIDGTVEDIGEMKGGEGVKVNKELGEDADLTKGGHMSI